MEKINTDMLRVAARIEDKEIGNLMMSLLIGYDRMSKRIDCLEEAICEICEGED